MKPNGQCHQEIPPAGMPPSNVEVEALPDGKGFCYKRPAPHDPVSHPSHYNQGTIEVIAFIEDQKLPYHEASALAYICRARFKGNEAEDLKKAIWYLSRKVELLGKANQNGQ